MSYSDRQLLAGSKNSEYLDSSVSVAGKSISSNSVNGSGGNPDDKKVVTTDLSKIALVQGPKNFK